MLRSTIFSFSNICDKVFLILNLASPKHLIQDLARAELNSTWGENRIRAMATVPDSAILHGKLHDSTWESEISIFHASTRESTS